MIVLLHYTKKKILNGEKAFFFFSKFLMNPKRVSLLGNIDQICCYHKHIEHINSVYCIFLSKKKKQNKIKKYIREIMNLTKSLALVRSTYS